MPQSDTINRTILKSEKDSFLMSLTREELFNRVSQNGQLAGTNLGKTLTVLQQFLIILNGSGLVASLAFIGTVLASKNSFAFIPFYWSTIALGLVYF